MESHAANGPPFREPEAHSKHLRKVGWLNRAIGAVADAGKAMLQAAGRDESPATATQAAPGRVKGAGAGAPGEDAFLERTAAVWQPLSVEPLTCDDAADIVENVTNFFRLLLDWDAADKTPSMVSS